MAARRTISPRVDTAIDTDLDLAPLLSIMVKLIPVLLLSSAFVQIMIIETELPQAVRSVIDANQNRSDKPEIEVLMDYQRGFEISITRAGHGIEKIMIPINPDKSFDFPTLNQELIKIKMRYTQIFELNLVPAEEVKYQDIVRAMDMARRPLDKTIKFEFTDPATNQLQHTDFMFPEVNFSNVLEG
jgi:biopolymer transport protein ExbD